jgi:hypothetical protein
MSRDSADPTLTLVRLSGRPRRPGTSSSRRWWPSPRGSTESSSPAEALLLPREEGRRIFRMSRSWRRTRFSRRSRRSSSRSVVVRPGRRFSSMLVCFTQRRIVSVETPSSEAMLAASGRYPGTASPPLLGTPADTSWIDPARGLPSRGLTLTLSGVHQTGSSSPVLHRSHRVCTPLNTPTLASMGHQRLGHISTGMRTGTGSSSPTVTLRILGGATPNTTRT